VIDRHRYNGRTCQLRGAFDLVIVRRTDFHITGELARFTLMTHLQLSGRATALHFPIRFRKSCPVTILESRNHEVAWVLRLAITNPNRECLTSLIPPVGAGKLQPGIQGSCERRGVDARRVQQSPLDKQRVKPLPLEG
jgi:hypothetical protein